MREVGVKGYDALMIIIHWSSALLVFGLFVLGWWMVDLTYYSNWYTTAPWWHKSLGLLVLFITLFRVVWRLVKGTPTIDGSALEKKAAKLGHVLLYISLLAVVFSGYLISTGEGKPISFFDWFDVPALPFQVDQQATLAGAIHEYAAYVLVILALGHGVMAVKHHFIDKRSTLIRMIKP
ncbi:cytochrome b [Idiomarina baltica]|uniref:cytochrome b n=1 Tax=Idiomarina baltica TaxID=190892 RepID=UPI00235727AE|nr:cytochrome b [Idiomarina baltica]